MPSSAAGSDKAEIRIFLASPGDVEEEREHVRSIIDKIRMERAFRDRVNLQCIAWDQAGVGVAMEAALTPQEAIARGMPKPSECDLVVVIFGSRIGTPLPPDYVKPDGSQYLSGTEWEFQEAVTAFQQQGRPSVWLYRRSQAPNPSLEDPNYEEIVEQWRLLKEFLESLNNQDGSIAGGVNYYDSSDKFRTLFEDHLRNWLSDDKGHAKHYRPKQYYQDCLTRWSDPKYALDKRFVHLTLLLDQGEEAQGRRWQSSERFQDLGEVLAKVPDPALVLLGPPGSGKSTLLRHYQMDCSTAVLENSTKDDLSQAPLSFFIPLNDYKTRHADESLPLPRDWLAERWETVNRDMPPLDTLLRQQRLTLLLDALNEMPQAGADPIRRWKDFLRELAQDWPGNRVIFSCRSLDYSASLSSKELPVPQVRIEPLSDEQVRRFVALYCPEHGPAIWSNLAGSRQLELLRSPYYLKMLVQQSQEGEIPEGRAALFTGFVRQAVQREVAGDNPFFQPDELLTERDVQRLTLVRTWKTPYDLPDHGILFDKLSALAFEMQLQRSEKEASQVRIDYKDSLNILAHERAKDILKAGEALGVLEEDLGREEVLYLHQLLQEYFAARWLTQAPEPRLVQVAWRIEEVSPSLEETVASLADSDPLPPLAGTGWEETTVLATAMATKPDEFVANLMEANLPLAGRCAAQPDVSLSTTWRDRICGALIACTQDTEADLRARIAAGLALGNLGDPRFERYQGPEGHEYLLPPLVAIAAGTYTIGSDEGHYERESPVHTVELAAFQMGQFPVTSAEWALFMKAGGYEDERWWETEAAKAWRRGEGTAEGPKQQWRESRQILQQRFDEIRGWHQAGRITSKQADDWEQMARMSDDRFEAWLNDQFPSGRQTQPAYWNDDAFNNPAQPVVGISWFEARAYCAWLSAQTGRPFRLPTEAEWEAAARGVENRRYAYGNDFDSAYCNTFETHIRRSTPIGVFPGGETPEGLIDMTGNSLDWSSSLFESYPYDANDGREAPEAEDGRRVVRGGGWDNGRLRARAAYRLGNLPGNRSHLLGFRVLCLAPLSGH